MAVARFVKRGRLYELGHVASGLAVRMYQSSLDTLIWPWFLGGVALGEEGWILRI